MRKFYPNTRGPWEQAEFRGETYNVVDAPLVDSTNHVYYEIKRPRTRGKGLLVRSDKLMRLDG